MMAVFEHDHPLTLVDLQVKDEDAEESDEEEDEEKEVVTQDEFVCPCKRCDESINGYYRYYYKCIEELCDYSLHKFCAELPAMLKHTSHPHPLTLTQIAYHWRCSYSQSPHGPNEVGYLCSNYFCGFHLDRIYGIEADKKRIYHPSHQHPLVSLISKPILCECNACGKEHKGMFFLCTTCPNFAIHVVCAFERKSLLIQQTTIGIFHHTHPLTLSYSFPKEEQEAKYHPTCRVCHGGFYGKEHLWIYKCEKCIYYVCFDCATARGKSLTSMLYHGGGKMVKNFKDADYPDIFHLPFHDQTYSIILEWLKNLKIPRQLFFKEVGPITYGIDKATLQHSSHHHELILVNTKCIDGASSSSETSPLMMCHNPMKKTELLCSGCVRPIIEMPFYKCGANQDRSCNFALHEWCTRLPTEVVNHPGHPQHLLVLMLNTPGVLFNIFRCDVCHLSCNGYAYGCSGCRYYVDVTCAFIPERITHKSHPDHLLKVKDTPFRSSCIMCLGYFGYPVYSPSELGFSCLICNVYIHPKCALLLPETIRHSYDKHPMKLSYLPIENHKSEYFCEICECELNPHSCFYHCSECAQSVHSACAPLILCCETETYGSYFPSNVYLFLNVKFGGTHKILGHPHPLSFAQGTKSDGQCCMCSEVLQYKMIFKCFECMFAIDYICCERLENNS